MAAAAAYPTTMGELLDQLGGIDPRRVRLRPIPGKATEKDLLRLLERDGIICELVDGVLVEKVMGAKESGVGLRLGGHLMLWVDARDVGVVLGAGGAMRLFPKRVRVPVVSFISWDQLPDKEFPAAPIPSLYPDLAVEVLSEGNTKGEMGRKLREYFDSGTRLVWYIDPQKRTAQVFTSPEESTTLSEKDTLDGGDVLPGFRLPLKELFARVPKAKGRKNGKSKRK